MIETDALQPLSAYPRDVVYGVLAELFDRVQDGIDDEEAPPALNPAIEAARRYARMDHAPLLERELFSAGHAVISNLVRLRAAEPQTTGG